MKKQLTPVLPEEVSIKIIGLGGVGAIIARYGCLFLSSPSLNEDARIMLIDGDNYEPKNACRMLFKNIGNKAEVMREELLEYLEDSRVTILALPEYVTTANIERLIQEDDIVFLAVDNHKTRNLVNEYCQKLEDITLISAGNDPEGQDTSGKPLRGSYGNCQIYIRRKGQNITNDLTRFHPEIADPKDDLPTEASCSEMLASVPQILFTNMQAAACALQAFYRLITGAEQFGEVAFDTVDAVMRSVPYPQPVQAPQTQEVTSEIEEEVTA